MNLTLLSSSINVFEFKFFFAPVLSLPALLSLPPSLSLAFRRPGISLLYSPTWRRVCDKRSIALPKTMFHAAAESIRKRCVSDLYCCGRQSTVVGLTCTVVADNLLL